MVVEETRVKPVPTISVYPNLISLTVMVPNAANSVPSIVEMLADPLLFPDEGKMEVTLTVKPVPPQPPPVGPLPVVLIILFLEPIS